MSVENTWKSDIRPAFAQANIPVVFTVDEGYFPYLRILLRSIVVRLNGNLDALVVMDGLPADGGKGLVESLGPRQNVSLRFLDIHSVVEHSDLKTIGTVRSLTRAASFRVVLPNLLANYDKFIYMDADMVCLGDLSKLFSEDVSQAWLGAVFDTGANANLKKRPGYYEWALAQGFSDWANYFNSGLLLFNAKAFRDEVPLGRLFDLIRENTRFFPDQDALNIVCQGRVKRLDKRWNMQVGHCWFGSLPPDPDPILVHYTGPKPWSAPWCAYSHYWWQECTHDEYVVFWMAVRSSFGQAWNFKKLHEEIAALRSSFSYRVGLLVTWPARKAFRVMRAAVGGVKRR